MQELFHLLLTGLRGSWRYRWPALVTAWVVCLIGWLFVFSMPDIYEARAQVFVDADSRLAEVMGQVGADPGVGSRVFVVRQAMLGRPQLEKVARETGIASRATTSEEFEKLINSLLETIGVVSGRSQQARNLFTITFRDSDPEMAVSVVTTLLDTFVQDVLKLREKGAQDVTGYLEEQLNHYSSLLSQSETALADFKKQHVGLLPGDSGDIFERLQGQIDALADLRLQLRIQEDRRTELRRQLKSETPYVPEGTAQAAGAPLPGNSTEATISELERRRAEMLLTVTERHPDVVAINEQLEQLYTKRADNRAALAAAGSGIEGASNSTNPVYQSVQIALNETGVRIAGFKSQIAQGETAVRRLKGQINTIPETEAQYSELTRNYAQYKSLYDELLLKKERERMGTVGEDRDVVSFNITEPPAASFEPVAPKRVLLLVGVLIVGLGVGGAVAFILHQLNPVFHEAKSLRTVTGRPVIGVVSMTWLERHKVERRVDFSSFAMVSSSLLILFVISIMLKDQIVVLLQAMFQPVTS